VKQLSGGISVDEGYREVVAGNSSRSSSSGPRPAPDGWDEDLGHWGSQEFLQPGMGEKGAGCGEIFPESVCTDCGHVHMMGRTCGKRSCPDCWGMWANKAAVRAARRIQAFRHTQPDNHKRQVAHAVVSAREGEVMNERQFWEGRSDAAEIAAEKGFRGFTVVPHAHRMRDEAYQQYKAENPDVGKWVWAREKYDELDDYAHWSPHYHIVGFTTPDMEEGTGSGRFLYHFIRSLDVPYQGVQHSESHEEVYGIIRYLLSHTAFPAGSTKQIVTWHGVLANNKFVEEATEDWQYQKPNERVLSRLEREIEDVVGVALEDDCEQSASDDVGDCPVDDCGGMLIDVFDVGQYLRQSDPPPDVRERMVVARDWRLNRIQPPAGMKHPATEEQAREVLEALL